MDETCTSLEIYQHKLLIYTREEPEACNLNEQTVEMRLNVPLFYFLAEGLSKDICFRFPLPVNCLFLSQIHNDSVWFLLPYYL